MIKEFVQDEEQKGNKVLLPKLNEDIIVIRVGDSDLIKIYSIKHRRFIRQFILKTNEGFREY